MERMLGVPPPGRGETHMFGGTPSNLAISIMDGSNIEVIAAVNLPMLIKLASVRKASSLEQAVIQAQDAGRRYICAANRVLGVNSDGVDMPFERGAKFRREAAMCHEDNSNHRTYLFVGELRAARTPKPLTSAGRTPDNADSFCQDVPHGKAQETPS
jgi:hypothetical protein